MKKQKKMLVCAMMLAVLALAGCGAAGAAVEETTAQESAAETTVQETPAEETASETASEVPQGTVRLANPFVDCADTAEAAGLAGFEFTVPDAVEGYPEVTVQAMEQKLAQIFYRNGDGELMIRKAVGSGDISGDYNVYSEQQTAAVDNREVLLKGKDGGVCTATWEEDGYTYAIVSSEPLPADLVTGLIQEVK